MEIKDLFIDLQDGIRLIRLLEAISGERLSKPNAGRMKVQRVENVNIALNFILSKSKNSNIKLENIGAEDIVSGNQTLILGLIWTVILRFQIQGIEVEIDDDVESESKDKRSAKEALLLWCRRRIRDYRGADVSDFSSSWRNGMAFNALIHSARPDLLDYDSLDPDDSIYNLNHAFELASKYLGISKLLDAEDIYVDRPDEKSILTYVSSFYHTYAKMKNEQVGGKRIGKIMGYIMSVDQMKNAYEYQTSELLNWINNKIIELNDYSFPNSLDGMKALTMRFKNEYMKMQKPPKHKQKSTLDFQFLNINMKLTVQGLAKYEPPEGKRLVDLEEAWSRLEYAEHQRDLALRDESERLEKLERQYLKFDKKAKLREQWLNDKVVILKDSSTFVNNTLQIDASFKKHEAIGADIEAGKNRFEELKHLALELIKADYFNKETIHKRNQQIQQAYSNLLFQFEERKATLNSFQELQILFQEMESLKNEMLELEVKYIFDHQRLNFLLNDIFLSQSSFQSKEYGEYLLAVEDSIAKHAILSTQIVGINQRLKSVNRRAQQFLRASVQVTSDYMDRNSNDLNESQLVKEKLDALNKAYELINVLAGDRRKYLEDRRDFYKLIEECDEELFWLEEKLQVIKSVDPIQADFSTIQNLLNKQEQLEDEIKFRTARIEKLLAQSSSLVSSKRFNSTECNKCLAKSSALESNLAQMKEGTSGLRSLLEDLLTSQQYMADVDEATAWCKDKLTLVSLSNDCGRDETSAQALLHRHARIHEQIRAYDSEVKRLREIADVLVGTRRFSSYPVEMRKQLMQKNK